MSQQQPPSRSSHNTRAYSSSASNIAQRGSPSLPGLDEAKAPSHPNTNNNYAVASHYNVSQDGIHTDAVTMDDSTPGLNKTQFVPAFLPSRIFFDFLQSNHPADPSTMALRLTSIHPLIPPTRTILPARTSTLHIPTPLTLLIPLIHQTPPTSRKPQLSPPFLPRPPSPRPTPQPIF
jgi:hypothetical protein